MIQAQRLGAEQSSGGLAHPRKWLQQSLQFGDGQGRRQELISRLTHMPLPGCAEGWGPLTNSSVGTRGEASIILQHAMVPMFRLTGTGEKADRYLNLNLTIQLLLGIFRVAFLREMLTAGSSASSLLGAQMGCPLCVCWGSIPSCAEPGSQPCPAQQHCFSPSRVAARLASFCSVILQVSSRVYCDFSLLDSKQQMVLFTQEIRLFIFQSHRHLCVGSGAV